MKKEDLYNLGNDYQQVEEVYFNTSATGVSGYYDGMYHETMKPVYELSGGYDSLNKRIFNVPQSAWAPNESLDAASGWSAAPAASAVFSPDYASAVVVALTEEKE